MSKGPSGVGNKGFSGKCYLHLNLTPKDWCTYKEGVCRINQLAFGADHICDNCRYKKRVDIPMILEKLNGEKNGHQLKSI